MENWITFWTWLLVIVLLIFFGLIVVVAVGGFFDLKILFRTINKQHRDSEEKQNSADT